MTSVPIDVERLAEAQKAVTDAAERLAEMVAEVTPLPTSRRINTTLRLEPKLLTRLKIVAARQRVRLNDLVQEGLNHVLAKYEAEAAA